MEAGGRLGSDQPGINGNARLSQGFLTHNVFHAAKHMSCLYFHQWQEKQGKEYFQMPAATGGPSLLLFCVLKGGLLQSPTPSPKPTLGLGAGSSAPARGYTSIPDTLVELMASDVPLAQMQSSYHAPRSSKDAWLSLPLLSLKSPGYKLLPSPLPISDVTGFTKKWWKQFTRIIKATELTECVWVSFGHVSVKIPPLAAD